MNCAELTLNQYLNVKHKMPNQEVSNKRLKKDKLIPIKNSIERAKLEIPSGSEEGTAFEQTGGNSTFLPVIRP